MFNVCPGCGDYSAEKTVDPSGPVAICLECGYRHPFVMQPLLVVTGASGTGKTTVALRLVSEMSECVCLESDILWSDAFNNPDDDYRQYRNLWLRMAKNIGQSGRPVVLFGTSSPGQFEKCVESRYFSSISYLTFVCDETSLVQRLKARPSWRKSGSENVLKSMVQFNQWLIDAASGGTSDMTLLDTSNMTLDESCAATRGWIMEKATIF